jgi:hypothetical protein
MVIYAADRAVRVVRVRRNTKQVDCTKVRIWFLGEALRRLSDQNIPTHRFVNTRCLLKQGARQKEFFFRDLDGWNVTCVDWHPQRTMILQVLTTFEFLIQRTI